jgi:hypothetical protein
MLTMFCEDGQVYSEKRGLTHANPQRQLLAEITSKPIVGDEYPTSLWGLNNSC